MSEEWTALDYERHKRRFIESRLLHRNLHVHASLIFGATLAVGWLSSWALLALGLERMPLRYAASFGCSYAAFLLLVRIWADFMRAERGDGGANWADAIDGVNAFSRDAEGCFFALAAWLTGFLLAVVFAWAGGLPLLLEVAFEVVFAGAMVRRARRITVVGDWLGALLRRTWVHATVTGSLLVAVAGYVQHKVPQAYTMREALRTLLAAPTQ